MYLRCLFGHKWQYEQVNGNIWRCCARCKFKQWWMPIVKNWSLGIYTL